MTAPERPTEVRGAPDLAELWRVLPVAVLRYPAGRLPPSMDLASLSDTLRARAWREHCAAAPDCCVELERNCLHVDQGCCRADILFPMQLGGGAQKWRMATLFVRWWPSVEALHLIALGETACAELGWAARCLHERLGFNSPESLAVSRFGDLELRRSVRWHLTFVTPWVVDKNMHRETPVPDAKTVAHELGKSIRARAHKLTALCTHDPVWQRLGGHLAHHIADTLLPEGISVERVRIEAKVISAALQRWRSPVDVHAWTGELTLAVSEPLLPWLSLLAICGGGENADKGFGCVELTPLHR